ncbi:MAG: Ig-like domain-containing protein, partial [Firmicutes bacterium]|nr:Ig-like domain-containing protein [Bacillota bacterium]
ARADVYVVDCTSDCCVTTHVDSHTQSIQPHSSRVYIDIKVVAGNDFFNDVYCRIYCHGYFNGLNSCCMGFRPYYHRVFSESIYYFSDEYIVFKSVPMRIYWYSIFNFECTYWNRKPLYFCFATSWGLCGCCDGMYYHFYTRRHNSSPVFEPPTVTSITLTGGGQLTIPYPIPPANQRPVRFLNATVHGTNYPPQSVTWTSSNTAVATVDTLGMVRAVTAGTAVITARSTFNTAVTAQTTITVTQAPPSAEVDVGVAPPLPSSAVVTFGGRQVSSANFSHEIGIGTNTITSGERMPNVYTRVPIPVFTRVYPLGANQAIVWRVEQVVSNNLGGWMWSRTGVNQSIISVADGHMTFKLPTSFNVHTGEFRTETIQIIAESPERPGVRLARFRVTVRANACPDLFNVSIIGAGSTFMDVTETRQLGITIAPTPFGSPFEVWLTNNAEIVAVTATGLITAVGVGIATIRASTSFDGKSFVRELTIMVRAPEAPTVVIDTSFTGVFRLGDTMQLYARVYPLTHSQAVTWTSSNPAVATVSASGLVTGISVGNAVIRATIAGMHPAVFGEFNLGQLSDSGNNNDSGGYNGNGNNNNNDKDNCQNGYYSDCDNYVGGGTTDSGVAGNNVTNHILWDNHGFRMVIAVMFLLVTISLAYSIVIGVVGGARKGFKGTKYKGGR